MKLFVIYQNYHTKEVKIEPAEIIKETEKTLQIVHDHLGMTIRKSDLPHVFRYDKLITTHVEGGITLWNSGLTKEIEACYRKIADLQSKQIIPE
jgi:hypothetical protein